MNSSGAAGNIGYCEMCHENGSEQNLPEGLNAMVDPQSTVNPMPARYGGLHGLPRPSLHSVSRPVQHHGTRRKLHVCHGPSGAYAVSIMA